ncbi:hypothetical protein [Gimesia algae]|uniref:LysM domain-containing protein n=1 Tax=Gimesia algae TaxID=2527971 RepID=A0A517VBT6_9PLAN|nr:hypothetical protein [Gimesia algae]QDT90456.1 hypothetical protein Pan161_21080 [Gimesia algae]
MDPLQQLMRQAVNAGSPFGENSRYHEIEITTCTLPDNRTVVHLRRRFLPQPGQMETLTEHVVRPDDRLDNLAYKYLDNPELFWQICDANHALRPADLTDDLPETRRPRAIRIAMPPGVPAPEPF